MESDGESSTSLTDINSSEMDQTQVEEYLEECEDVFSQISENLMSCIQMIENIAQRIDQNVIRVEYNKDVYTMSDLILQFQKEYEDSNNGTSSWGSFVFDKLQQCSKIESSN
jgi:hypothetical protein